ncbi:unnamed protein product [Aspergillus oryzae var. brunneus]|uniref:Unnamed protein product n=1 Tax=Aspergillus oryzae var. brunneus TaxID=332754 RepID=A0ABQ6L7C5_ASPOZ|nr:unnamed protein product [Aspergillus oryzae var. brunneus]
MHLFSTLLTLALLATAMAHAGPHDILSRSEISRRSAMGLKCRENVSQYHKRRWKRNIDRRWHGHNTTFSVHTEAPYFETIQNDTCVLTPEVTEGPYVYPPSQTLRRDMTENQPGVPLWLDIGVLDMATCEPLEDVLIDMWHCNATGSYSSFTHLAPNTPFVELLNELGINGSDYKIGITDLHTDNTTFLRGMWPTDKHGMMEMKTIFPGNVVSTGQLYFDEALAEKIMSLEPYASHTQINRTTNAEDSIFPYDTAGGFNPVVDIVPMDGKDVTKGMIGYITLGVDTSAIEHGDNYVGVL